MQGVGSRARGLAAHTLFRQNAANTAFTIRLPGECRTPATIRTAHRKKPRGAATPRPASVFCVVRVVADGTASAGCSYCKCCLR
jgi:hypothetical protein